MAGFSPLPPQTRAATPFFMVKQAYNPTASPSNRDSLLHSRAVDFG